MVNCEGWTCPTCRRNHAPWMPSCNCINSAVGVSTTSITITPHADPTAELVEALRVARDRLYGIETARNRGFDLHYAEGSARAGVREIDAALARVKGER